MNSSDATGPELREEILRLVARYHAVAHAPKPFVPGETKIPYAGRVYRRRRTAASASTASCNSG